MRKKQATTQQPKMETWEKETRDRLKRLGYNFGGHITLTKEQAIKIVLIMKSNLGRYNTDNAYAAQNEIDYLTLVHNITYGDIWDYRQKNRGQQ